MWIVSNKGFASIVAKDAAGKPSGNQPDSIVSVRFRRPKDAAALFPDHKCVDTPGGDYACRVFATREEVALVLAREVLDMSYSNFKSSIPLGDPALNTAAHSAWTVFGRLQEGGPYARDYRSALPRWDSEPAWVKQRGLFDDSAFDPFREDVPLTKKARKKAVKLANRTHRRDPFCDSCGMRAGPKNLDEHGNCADCSAYYAKDSADPVAVDEFLASWDRVK